MEPVKIAENVYWVGGIDWDLRNFHGYLTQKGSTYNAYLIIDKKITLIDTVKSYLADEMIERISKIIDPSKIDYIISNHVEMDHSGALPKIMELNPKATIFTSKKGEEGLKAHYKKDWNFRVLTNNEEVSLGSKNVQFVMTPMVHWPDNMVSYLKEDKILFSNDAFGQHIASMERIDKDYCISTLLEEAKKYYANIVLPYSAQVSRAVNSLSGLDIKMIAPSHGLIWQKNIKEIIESYTEWMNNTTKEKAVIIYDSMWGSTKKIANTIASAFNEKGITPILKNLETNHISDIMTDIIDAKYICIGSPTLNNNMLPTVAAFLTYFKGLAPKNRTGLAFGSYGWGGQSIGMIEEALSSCKLDQLEAIRTQYIPDEDTLKEIKAKLIKSI